MDGIVLLHGIARRSGSLASLERHLQSAGYATLNLDYPARQTGLRQIAEELQQPIAAFADGLAGQLHFVTHSMGAVSYTHLTLPTKA